MSSNRWVKQREVLNYLNSQLPLPAQPIGGAGGVVSVVTFNRDRSKITCYGYHIHADRLFCKLHPAIGTTAIATSSFNRLTSWKKGYLVRLREFEPENDRRRRVSWWVALINFDIVDLDPIVPFPRLTSQ